MSEQTTPDADAVADASTVSVEPTATPEADPAEVERDKADADRKAAEIADQLESARGDLAERDRALADLRLSLTARDVSDETGVPRGLLKGSTREELETSALALREWADAVAKVGTPRAPIPTRPARSPFQADEPPRSGREQAANLMSTGSKWG